MWTNQITFHSYLLRTRVPTVISHNTKEISKITAKIRAVVVVGGFHPITRKKTSAPTRRHVCPPMVWWGFHSCLSFPKWKYCDLAAAVVGL